MFYDPAGAFPLTRSHGRHFNGGNLSRIQLSWESLYPLFLYRLHMRGCGVVFLRDWLPPVLLAFYPQGQGLTKWWLVEYQPRAQ